MKLFHKHDWETVKMEDDFFDCEACAFLGLIDD